MCSNILVILTGGTISRIGRQQKHNLKNDFIYSFLKDARLDQDRYNIRVNDMFTKYSGALTECDLQDILGTIRTCHQDKILITCGTDAIVQIAMRFQNENLERKTIVFTGSMVPYKHAHSDARANLMASLFYLATSSPAMDKCVTICMQGAIYKPHQVTKNIKLKRIERIHEDTINNFERE